MQWFADKRGVIHGHITLDQSQQGPPGHAHGGATAALLDDAMGSAVWYAGHMVMAVNLNLNYRLPVPLNLELKLSAWVDRVEGRKVFTQGQLCLPDGSIAVEGAGIFVEAGEVLRRFLQDSGQPLADFGHPPGD